MHKINRKVAVFLAAVMALSGLTSCSMDEDRRSDTVAVEGREVSTSGMEAGTVIVKLTQDLVDELGLESDGSVRLQSSGVKAVDDAIASLGVTNMERVFTYDPETEDRIRARGMHLYYVVNFDKDQPLTRALEEFKDMDGVEMVEMSPKIVRIDNPTVVKTYSADDMSDIPGRTNAATELFNDPRLGQQWHYYNDGSMTNTIAGADINVLPVWQRGMVGNRYTTDGREIIVAVVDGGVDYTHEDLADNMWTASDGTHGYNFVTSSTNVTADEHGTHVAGTIAAINNNGVGVCGVAGGDAANGVPGVRIMSCQIFQGEAGCSGNALAQAIRWGADRGAVICQNSWGYDKESVATMDDTPAVIKQAIDYFIEVAGTNGSGVQTGPMKGGVVIFAAGNDEMSKAYPPSYESVIAVSAISGDYQPAYYTNYGDWVDVCAPGGDYYNATEVLSTTPNNTYSLMQGTSMACPHVSGIAALLVSAFGGPGFTSDQLRMLIEETTRDMSQYMGVQFSGRGLVDTEAAVGGMSTVAPDPITDLEVEARANLIYYSFSVPADEDNGTPATARIYYSENQFSADDDLQSIPYVTVSVSGMSVGDKVTGTLPALEFDREYWVSAVALDVARNMSELPDPIRVMTGENSAPYFVPSTDLDTTAKQSTSLNIDMQVRDDDGHTLTPSVNISSGVSVSMLNDSTVRAIISTQTLGVGSHVITVTVSDGYDQASRNINLSIAENHAPELLKEMDDVVLSVGGRLTEDMSQYFSDPDGDALTYRIQYTTAGIVTGSVVSNSLELTAQSQGTTDVTISAVDDMGLSASMTFSALVRDNARKADFYPNPVVDILNIRTGETATAASVKVIAPSGATVASETGLTITPFDPYQLDMSGLAGGMYKITLTYTGENGTTESITTDIAKL